MIASHAAAEGADRDYRSRRAVFAFTAGAGQGSALLGLPIGRHGVDLRLDGTTVPGDALIKTAKCNTTLIKGYSDGGASAPLEEPV